jgi:transglutaminase-like putative cysteine protease
MKDVRVLDIFPPPTDRYQDGNGNEIAFWQIDDQSSREYGVVFEVSVQPIVYDIDPNSIGAYDKASELCQQYTRPSTWVQSDYPEIIAQARQVVGDEQDPFRQAKLIHQWVARNIKGGEAVDALTALHQRAGDCGPHAFLLVAMLRSLGIPARSVAGMHARYTSTFESASSQQRSMPGHVWAEFYLPSMGWVQLDASAGEQNFAGISEPRIILSKGEDIQLSHGYPLQPLAWFHTPHSDRMTGSTPPTQTWGEELRLEVERIR